ncbi:MAG TPA: glycoside hydrolase family 15 protein [bacterium]|jgi:glucoamylase
MSDGISLAPGWPGITPRWTSSNKSGVGTSLSPFSHVTFTLSHGILNEIYYPQSDLACTRDMGLLIVDGQNYFSEEKRHCSFTVNLMREGVPAYHLVNTSLDGEYVIEKECIGDPWRDVVLQHIRFRPLRRAIKDFTLLALLAPHIANRGMGNTAWVGDYKGTPMLFAERNEIALAMACSLPFTKRSVGFVGYSDGWQDADQHKKMTWEYQRAEDGNVAMTGEIVPDACDGEFTIAIGFGRNHTEAALRALSSIQSDFDNLRDIYVRQWEDWFNSHEQTGSRAGKEEMSKLSLAVSRIHSDKIACGASIASLSVPWGQNRGDDDLGGYHLVWVRDLIETVCGMLAAGVREDVRLALEYLRATQEKDGFWPQNMWLDGRSFWTGIQMDEIGLPILLLELARREHAIREEDVEAYLQMVHHAASFIVRNGPVTQQDRWEEDAGYSPSTLAVEIAALLVAAEYLERMNRPDDAKYLRETADCWNQNIERWCYVKNTGFAQKVGVDGYYVRIAPPDVGEAASPHSGYVPIKNRPPGQSMIPAEDIVSTDALALVRFGLRDAHDPRIVNTVKVIDHLLKVNTQNGPCWYRYNGDGYGEHEDGSAFDGTGTGRLWPLLTGERGHYELEAGNVEEATRLLDAMEKFTSDVGLIPEQIWDTDDLPERELFFGRPSGSAMPLVWAHSEHIRLTRSISDGTTFDMPAHTVDRYRRHQTKASFACWRFNNKLRTMNPGLKLRVELLASARVRWSLDDWATTSETDTTATSLGIHYCDLPADALQEGQMVRFTIYWQEPAKWEERNYDIKIEQDG